MFSFLQKIFYPNTGQKDISQTTLIQQASALLMLAVAHADQDYSSSEKIKMLETIKQTYQFSTEESQSLLAKLETESNAITSLHTLTRTLVEQSTIDERIEVVKKLWQVAYADGNIDHYEEHIIRRVSTLLYLSNKDFIQAKFAAKDTRHR